MMVALISAGSAVIVGILTLVGVLASNNAHQAVADEKIAELTREVRKHNQFAERIPEIEGEIKVVKKDIENLKEIYACK